MPRSGWVKPESDRRLSDLVSVGLLTRVFPPGLVDEVIAAAGRTEKRRRSLPARVVAYFVVGMALFSDASYEDVLAYLTDGLSWASRWRETWKAPSKSAIFQARARLGFEPLRELFRRVARPLAGAGAPGAWLAGRRLVAIDGMCIDLADTDDNATFFGRPGVNKGERSAFPQARVVALAECGSHAVFAAVIGTYPTGETTLAGELADSLGPDMLLIADRGFYGFGLWRRLSATGADLLWRVSKIVKPVHVETLPDGSWLGDITGTNTADPKSVNRVRVIDYTIHDGRPEHGPYRLLTTILDPDVATAVELAATYNQRWEIESTFDELKTHQRGARMVLRSKSPDLVHQELWGHLCCHYAIRTLMWEAAAHTGADPDRVSFVAALRICRRSIAHQGDFPPSGP